MAFLMVLVLSLGVVSGVEFLPSSLTFLEGLDDELCQVIEISDENYQGKIFIDDLWAESYEERDIENFSLDAGDLGLSISYVDTIVGFEESIEIEVCVDGEESGRFMGVLVYQLEEGGEEEIGSWIFVDVEEPSVVVGGGGSGGGGNGRITTISVQAHEDEIARELEEFEIRKERGDFEEPAGITGSAVDESVGPDFISGIIPLIFILFVAAASFYVRRKRRIERFGKI